MRGHRTTVVVAVAATVALSAGGCAERVCASDQYPVRTVDPTDGGLACAPEGEEPPAGYERFPEGEDPEYVDDLHP